MKIKTWAKDHKQTIVKIAAITAGGIAAVVIGKKVLKKALTLETQVKVPVQSVPITKIKNEVTVPDWIDVGITNDALGSIINRSDKATEELAQIIGTIKDEITEPGNGIGVLINTNRDNTLGFQYIT